MTIPSLNGCSIIARTNQAIYIRIPRELQKPCDGCDCPWCAAHPNETPAWDTLAIPAKRDKIHEHGWTVHMPDPKQFVEHINKFTPERAYVETSK